MGVMDAYDLQKCTLKLSKKGFRDMLSNMCPGVILWLASCSLLEPSCSLLEPS